MTTPFTFPTDSAGRAGAVTPMMEGERFVVPVVDVIGHHRMIVPANLAANATYTGPTRDRLSGGLLEARVRFAIDSNVASAASGVIVEESHDGTTFATIGTASTLTAANLLDTGWRSLTRRYWRLRYVNGATAQTRFEVSELRDCVIDDVAISGTATVAGTVTAAQATAASLQMTPVQSAAASLRAALGVATAGGATPLHLTNVLAAVQTVKASAGHLYEVLVHNPSAATAYLQVHNATAPTIGTTVPLLSVPVAAGQTVGIGNTVGFVFGTAITVAATTTARGATAPTVGLEVNVAYA